MSDSITAIAYRRGLRAKPVQLVGCTRSGAAAGVTLTSLGGGLASNLVRCFTSPSSSFCTQKGGKSELCRVVRLGAAAVLQGAGRVCTRAPHQQQCTRGNGALRLGDFATLPQLARARCAGYEWKLALRYATNGSGPGAPLQEHGAPEANIYDPPGGALTLCS